MLPNVSNYTYLGIGFSYNRAWDTHIGKLTQNGKKKVNQMLLLSVLHPNLSMVVKCGRVISLRLSL